MELSKTSQNAIDQKKADDARKAAERQHVKDLASILDADGLDPTDHHVRQVKKFLADLKATQQRAAAAKEGPAHRPFANTAARNF